MPKKYIRCELTEKGLKSFKNRQGYIVGETIDDKCWIILWDNLKQKQRFHKDFIKIIEEAI